jgi:PAS domain S-box-containing protein
MSSKKTKKDNEHFSIISHNLDRHALITNANDYVIITNNRDKIEWVNEGFTRITGYKLWDVIGHSPAALLRGTGTDAETRKRIDEKAKQREIQYGCL